MTREEAVYELERMKTWSKDLSDNEIEAIVIALKALSNSDNPNKWIPVKWHEITDEEREREDYPKEWACHLDCIMPYDGQRILITTKGGFVELDECYSDDGCTFNLDSGYDWVDDVVAWCELPEPYKQEVEG
jgi:hypothetical protein